MDEFLSEKEQIEIFRQWWRENGWYLVGGIGLGVLGLLGWNRYNAYVDTTAEEAAAIYVELRDAVGDDDMGSARNLLNELRDDFPSSAYTDQGGLLVALVRLDAGQVDGAVDDLRFVMESTSDPELALIARLRLARVLAQDESYEEALTVLDVAPGAFPRATTKCEATSTPPWATPTAPGQPTTRLSTPRKPASWIATWCR